MSSVITHTVTHISAHRRVKWQRNKSAVYTRSIHKSISLSRKGNGGTIQSSLNEFRLMFVCMCMSFLREVIFNEIQSCKCHRLCQCMNIRVNGGSQSEISPILNTSQSNDRGVRVIKLSTYSFCVAQSCFWSNMLIYVRMKSSAET